MSPQELFDLALDILRHCDANGVPEEKAATFIQSMQASMLSIHQWLPPVLGTEAYGDGTLIDLIRQARFQSEKVMKDFPKGIELFTNALIIFCVYLQKNYLIRSAEPLEAPLMRS